MTELAKELFVAQKYGESLVVLEAAKHDGLEQKEQLERQKLVVQLHATAQRKDWLKVRPRTPSNCEHILKRLAALDNGFERG